MVAALSACAAPRPHLAVPPEVLSADWRGPSTTGATLPESLAAAFRAPVLAELTSRALAGNADLAAATARIEQARAQMRIARASMFPTVSATAGASATRSDGGGSGVRFESNGGFAGLDVSYELDLFGREAAGRRSVRAQARAAQFDREALALTIEAELARALLQSAALAERLRLLDRGLVDARELDRVIGVRFRLGEATRLETAQQAIELKRLETERLRLAQAREQTRNAAAILVGEEAPTFDLPDIAFAALAVPEPAVVQPAELLVRRPDIRAAEARIAAAAGDVDRARAAFLPSIRLSASGIGEAATLGGPVAAVLSIGAGLLAPIFEGGRLRGELDLSAATQRESVELYRGALLTALGEAQNALAAVRLSEERAALQAAAVEEARTAAQLSLRRYLEGETDFQFVADARADLVAAEDAAVLARQERLEAAIDLYRAMGGPARPAITATPGALAR